MKDVSVVHMLTDSSSIFFGLLRDSKAVFTISVQVGRGATRLQNVDKSHANQVGDGVCLLRLCHKGFVPLVECLQHNTCAQLQPVTFYLTVAGDLGPNCGVQFHLVSPAVTDQSSV